MMRSSGDSRGLMGRTLAFVAALAVVLTGVLFATTSKAEALDGSSFNPAYIISDLNFFNPNTMSQAQILTSAATSVLAQANSAPQAILKLLQ